eukprot:1347764-Prorocentrum_lima.AAC.1
MHSSMWLMIKGKKPLKEAKMAQPVPAKPTYTGVKGHIKGRIALFVDDMIHIYRILGGTRKEMDN